MRGGVGAAAGEQLGRSDSRNSVDTLSTVTKPSSHGGVCESVRGSE